MTIMCLLDEKKVGKVGELIVVERTKVLIYDAILNTKLV